MATTDDSGKNEELTPAEKTAAAAAAHDILWHRDKIKLWKSKYDKAVAAGDYESAQNIDGLLEMHAKAIDAARKVLEDLGL